MLIQKPAHILCGVQTANAIPMSIKNTPAGICKLTFLNIIASIGKDLYEINHE